MSNSSMLCAVMYDVGDVRIGRRAVPQPEPNEVLVRIKRVGVCGSDVHYFTHGRIGDFVVKDPLILGHESAGVVEKVGGEVQRFTSGDRVTIEPGHTCGECFYCKTGHYNLCPHVVFMATPPIDGAFCEYVAWPQDFVFALPDNMSLEEGAMMEPLSVGLWAVKRGEVDPGDSVAVFGCGPIGLLTLQAARAAGATTLIAVDVEGRRLQHARRVGATHVVNDRQTNSVDRIGEITSGLRGFGAEYSGVDVAFETAGAIAATQNTLAAVRPGGVAVLVGLPPESMVEIDLVSASSKEIDIRGQFRYANRYPPAIALTAKGEIDVASLVTHHFPLEDVAEALRFADEHKAESLKVVVDVGD
ncbi:MAG: NAD(P)-dependent alcohol dehydrogenase [Anaerolineales bacterium]